MTEKNYCPHCLDVLDKAIAERHKMRVDYASQVAKKRKWSTRFGRLVWVALVLLAWAISMTAVAARSCT